MDLKRLLQFLQFWKEKGLGNFEITYCHETEFLSISKNGYGSPGGIPGVPQYVEKIIVKCCHEHGKQYRWLDWFDSVVLSTNLTVEELISCISEKIDRLGGDHDA